MRWIIQVGQIYCTHISISIISIQDTLVKYLFHDCVPLLTHLHYPFVCLCVRNSRCLLQPWWFGSSAAELVQDLWVQKHNIINWIRFILGIYLTRTTFCLFHSLQTHQTLVELVGSKWKFGTSQVGHMGCQTWNSPSAAVQQMNWAWKANNANIATVSCW